MANPIDSAANTRHEFSLAIPLPVLEPSRRYELSDEIARGGMGIIYRATDTAFGREVAVKVLQDKYGAASGAARRFAEEARITGQLQHPAIPPVHDLGTLPDGRPFLAMKLVRGQTLDQILKDRTDPTAEAGRLLAAFELVCQAVAFAHSHGVIHRDLKPANVMLGSFAEVQVMDWGLAKDLSKTEIAPCEAATVTNLRCELSDTIPDDSKSSVRAKNETSSDLTQAGEVIGTPAYMPPEQALGEVERIDRRSDVFSLGGILCAILTGKPPYDGKLVTVMRKAATGELSGAWSRLDGCGADAELIGLCKLCLSPDAANRPVDGNAVARLVADYRVGVEERLRAAERERAATVVRSAERRKKRPMQLALAAALGMLVFAGVSFIWWQNRQAGERRVEQERSIQEIEALLERCEEAIVQDDEVAAADFALKAAEKRAENLGTDQLKNRLARNRLAVDVLKELDRIDSKRYADEWGRNEQGSALAVREWPAVFARVGVEVGRTPSNAAAFAVNDSLANERLLASLEMWLVLAGEADRPQLAAILNAADPDPYRDAIRDALAKSDAATVASLAQMSAALDQPARFAAALGSSAALPTERRRTVLEAAARNRPRNFGVLMTAGDRYDYNKPATALERIAWFRGAVILRPTNAIAHFKLAHALNDKDDLDGAIAEYREAIRLDPNFGIAHGNLGNCFYTKGDFSAALEEYREAAKLEPNWDLPHGGIANILFSRGELDGAKEHYLKALAINANIPTTRAGYGDVYLAKGDPDGAIAEYRVALRLDSKFAYAHYRLGLASETIGDLKTARNSFREAFRLLSKFPEYRTAELRTEAALKLFQRLPEILAGECEPISPAEICSLALNCAKPFSKRYATACRLYSKAFEADPNLDADPEARHRYFAAVIALRASRGEGNDAPVRPEDRAELRAKALVWLREASKGIERLFASSKVEHRKLAIELLGPWPEAPELNKTRPGDERKDWTKRETADWDAFWSDVKRTVAEAKKPILDKGK